MTHGAGMVDEGYGTGGPPSEAELRVEIEALERQRVDAVEARITLHRGLPVRLLFEVGQPWVAWLWIVLLLGDIGLAVAIRSWQIALIGLVLIGALSAYSNSRIEGWVARYNAGIDSRIRALLARAADETT